METLQSNSVSEKKQPKRLNRVLLGVVWGLSILLTAVVTVAVLLFSGKEETTILREAMEIIRSNFYFYEKESDTLVDGAIAGMTKSLNDTYSQYYSAEEYAELTKSNSGYYTGIGIVLQQQDVGQFEIIQVYAGTPAEEAGLLSGDRVTELNGVKADGLDLGTFLNAMHAEDGGRNEMIVLRDGTELSFTVTAREIYAPTVTYRMQTDSIGYLHLNGFHGDCVTEVKEAIEALREQGMQSLIFDVRDNPGGSLYDVCDIADLFLPKGLVITSLRSRTDRQKDYKTEQEGYVFPMVLLVNENSASASELLSGALRDHNRAHLIGTRTFGKGIVQSYFPVAGTGGYIKITTEAYYTPSGVCIQGEGIEPDETVENPENARMYAAANIPLELNLQLQKAIAYLSENAPA